MGWGCGWRWRGSNTQYIKTLNDKSTDLWQQNFGEHPIELGKVYHNKEFIDKCKSLGLHPMPVKGCHIAVADGVFAQLMAELGIERPDTPPTAEPLRIDWYKFLEDYLGKEEKGRSNLKK